MVPVGDVDAREAVAGVFAVVFDQVDEGDGEQVEVTLDGDHALVVGLLLFEKQLDAVIGVGPEDKRPHVEQQFVEADLLHLDLLLPVVGPGQVEQSVDQAGHAAGILQRTAHRPTVVFAAPLLLQGEVQLGDECRQRGPQLVRNVADKLLLGIERGFEPCKQVVERQRQLAQFVPGVLHGKAPVDPRGGDRPGLLHDAAHRLQGGTGQQITGCKKQKHPDNEQHAESHAQLGQIGVPVAVVGRRRHDVVRSAEGIEHPDSLIPSDAELDPVQVADPGDHRRILLDDVAADGVVVEHAEVGRVDRHLDLVDEVAVVEVDLLHGPGIDPALQEEVGLGDRLALEIMIKGPAARVFADQIDGRQTGEEDGGRGQGVLQREGGADLHGLSVRMKPMPGRVWIRRGAKSRSTFLRR